MAEFEIKGGAEIAKALRELPLKLETRVLRGAMREGAEVIAEDARARVPRRTGKLLASIKVRLSTKRGKVTASVEAGGRGKGKPWYAHLVEFGTAPHEIRPKGKKSLFFAGIFSKVIQHPGTAPRPFLRPALDSQAGAAINAVAAHIRARLDRIAKRGAK